MHVPSQIEKSRAEQSYLVDLTFDESVHGEVGKAVGKIVGMTVGNAIQMAIGKVVGMLNCHIDLQYTISFFYRKLYISIIFYL